MIRAVLIDDEINGIKGLQLLIEKYCPQVKIVASTKEPVKGVELIEDYRPELVFLDINMPKLNGFELLDKLIHKDFQLIFTTAHEEYALKAIKQSAVDYLLKPITADDLKIAVAKVEKLIKEKSATTDISKILKELSKETPQRISINTKNSIEVIGIQDIVYIESLSGGVNVVLINGNILKTLKPLKDFEDLLCEPNENFIRIQNSFIINVNSIKSYVAADGGFIIMSDDKKITISRDKKPEFLRIINRAKA